MQWHEIDGKFPVPLSAGAFIFDEVKVGMKLQWNSSNDNLVGYAMSREEMSSLSDVYEVLEDDFRFF